MQKKEKKNSKDTNLIGKKFNLLTAVIYDSSNKNGNRLWLFKCECGNEKILCMSDVKRGRIKSCGCLGRYKEENLEGQKINRYTFIKFDSRRNRISYWLCRCDCGTEKVVSVPNIKRGDTKSCGCLKNEHEDLTGQKFNRWTYLEHKHDSYWLCRCDCGTEKIVNSGNIKNNSSKSCGCYNKEILMKRKGKNHPLYRHDLTKEDREENKYRNLSGKVKIWRIKIYERDNYTCQCCGDDKSGKLEAHHIYSWHSHRKLRHVISNGITLCVVCHKKFHKQFSQKNNTRKQLNKFLKENYVT